MKKILLFSLLIIQFSNVFSQYISGSEIYYEKIGNRKYKITAHVYRACDFATLTSVSGFVIADTIKRSVTMTRQSITKLNDTCGNPCNLSNQVSNAGFERHVFEAIVDFNQAPYNRFINANKCMVSFALSNNYRDGRSTTHTGGNYYNEATVNICDSLISNTSPRFSIAPKFLMMCNNAVNYSPGPIDTADYDSLVFTLEPVLTNYNTSITYNTNYSAKIPLTPYCPSAPGLTTCKALPTAKPPRGFYFDTSICQIIFTPTDCTEKGYTRIKISEYRKINGIWKLLGSVSRDMMVSVQSPPNNNLPTINFTPKSPYISICNKSTTLSMTTTDQPYLPIQTTYDTTSITYDNAYSKDLFFVDLTYRERSAFITLYNDSNTYNKPQYFTISTYDKQCNINLQSYTFKVQNYKIADYTKGYTIDSCNNIVGYAKSIDSTITINGGIYLIDPQGYSVQINNPYRLNKNGTYVIRYQYSSNNNTCYITKFDTLVVNNARPNPVLNMLNDTSVCSSYPFSLRFERSKISSLQSWTWYKNDTIINKTDSFISGKIYNTSNIKLKIEFDQNCVAEVTRKFTVFKPNIQTLQFNSIKVCRNNQFPLVANIINAKFPISINWKLEQQDTTINSNQITLKSPINDSSKLRVRLVDANHCIADDTMLVMLQPEFKFDFIQDKAQFCADSILKISLINYQGNPIRSTEWSSNNIPIFGSDLFSRSHGYASKSVVRVIVKDSFSCQGYDSIIVSPINNPKINILPFNATCYLDTFTIEAQITDLTSNNQKLWYLNSVLIQTGDSILSAQALGSSSIKLIAINEQICRTEKDINLIVHPLPIVKIKPDTLFNQFAFIELESANDHIDYVWSTGDSIKKTGFWAYELGNPGKHKIWLKATDINGCQNTDSLDIFTDRFTSLESIRESEILIYPNPVQSILYIETGRESAFKIYSLSGQNILEGTLEKNHNEISLVDLSAGIYMIEIEGRRQLIIIE
ncbi:MAG: T9SS type A sorting domain-containing protein [Bacteroidia bacterium]|nr:T9SS type A sorting domain-containing protein [Bacteroidia bacterium]